MNETKMIVISVDRIFAGVKCDQSNVSNIRPHKIVVVNHHIKQVQSYEVCSTFQRIVCFTLISPYAMKLRPFLFSSFITGV